MSLQVRKRVPLPGGESEIAGLIAILLGAFALRVARLGREGLWHDEVSGVVYSLQPLAAITNWAAVHDPHPPLSYWLLHAWMLLAGSGEFAVRYLSVVAGSLTMAALYHLLRKVVSRWRALLGTLALAVSGFHVYYSQEARMHILACLLGTLAAGALLTALSRPSLWRWAAYGALATASLYTFYLSALVLLAINLPVLVQSGRRSRMWLLSNAIAVALWLPWLATVYLRTTRFLGEPTPRVDSPLSASTFVGVLTSWSFGPTAGTAWGAPLAVLLLFALLASAMRLAAHPTLTGSMFVLWAFLPAAGVYLSTMAGTGVPDTAPRLELISLPAWIAVLLAGWPRRWSLPRPIVAIATAWLAIASVLALSSIYTRASRDDYRAAFAQIRRDALPQEALIYDAPEQAPALQYYFPDLSLPSVALPDPRGLDQTNDTLAQLAGSQEGVWALLYGEPVPWVENWLDGHLLAASDQWFGPYLRLKHYLPPPLAPDQTLRDGVRVDQQLGPLELRQVRPAGPVSKDAVPLELLWRAAGAAPLDFRRSLQLFDVDGQRVAQLDGEPLFGALPTSHWIPGMGYREPVVMHTTRPLSAGPYVLQVAVYDPATGLGQPRPVLRIASLDRERSLAVRAASNAGWTITSIGWGAGGDGALLVELSGSVQSAPTTGYTWFAHLLGANGQLVGQDDHPPIAPTTSWKPGDRFQDVFRLPSPDGAGWSLALGAYDGNDRRVQFSLADGAIADHVTVLLD